MNSGWPTQRLSEPCRSTRPTTAASKPIPVWKQKYRPLTEPSPTRRTLSRFDAVGDERWPPRPGRWAARWCGRTRWSSRPGARRGRCRSRRCRWRPRSACRRHRRRPRRRPPGGGVLGEPGGVAPAVGLDDLVRRAPAPSVWCTTTVLRAVTDEANELTTSRSRKKRHGTVERGSPPLGAKGQIPTEWPAMNVIVCVKQIPDPAAPGALDPSTNTLKREGKLILDESDSYGVEMALQLVDAAGGGEVQPGVDGAQRRGVGPAHGAGHGCGQGRARVRSRPCQGSDALTTAKVLAKAIERVGGADLVIAATESTDGYTGTVPEQIAEVLGLPSVTFAKHVEVDGATVKVQRQTEAGYDEVTCPLPAVVSVTAGVVEPRYPSFKGIMAAKSKPVDTVTAADLGVERRRLGRRRPGDRRRRRRRGARGRRDRRGRRRGLRQDRQPSSRASRSSETRRGRQPWPSTTSGSSPRPPTARPPRAPSSC